MIIYIPIKKNSQRVPNKNFRNFRGKPLWLHTVDKFLSGNFEVFIDTDSQEIIDSSHFDNVTVFKRKSHLVGDEVSVIDLLKDFVDSYSIKETVCQIHVTSPLLNIDHVEFAFSKIDKQGYDSVFSVDVVQKRFWRKERYGLCPINHNPMKLEQTQDLPEWYCENSYLYAFKPQVLNTHNRIGGNPYIFEVGFPYNLDIDTEEDWKILKGHE